MNCYELIFILRPDLNTQDVEKVTAEMEAIAKRENIEIAKKEYWGLRKLAYLVNKNTRGHFMFFGIKTDNSAGLDELERNISINENIMRQLTIKVEEIEKDPSAPIRQEEEREYNKAA